LALVATAGGQLSARRPDGLRSRSGPKGFQAILLFASDSLVMCFRTTGANYLVV
jgi:hypothetical protein